MTESCYECGRSFNLVPDAAIVRHRESVDFGAANDRLRSFCDVVCRARYRGSDYVIDSTRQTWITAWSADGIDLESTDAITWSC